MKGKMLLITMIVLIVLCIIVCLLFIFKSFRKVEIKDITLFSFGYSVGNYMDANVSYSLECSKTCIATVKKEGVKDEDANKIEVDSYFIEGLEDILKKYDVASWNGFSKNDNRVLDGYSFSLYIKMSSGDSISASGYMKWPKNYKEVRTELNQYFGDLVK